MLAVYLEIVANINYLSDSITQIKTILFLAPDFLLLSITPANLTEQSVESYKIHLHE